MNRKGEARPAHSEETKDKMRLYWQLELLAAGLKPTRPDLLKKHGYNLDDSSPVDG